MHPIFESPPRLQLLANFQIQSGKVHLLCVVRAYIVSALHGDHRFYNREGMLIKWSTESKKYSQRAPKWLRVSGAFAGWRWGGRVGRAVLLGWWRCHGVGAGVLVSEGEGPDNQHEVEGGRGDGGGESMTKGEARWWL